MANQWRRKTSIDSTWLAYTQCDYSYAAHYKDGAWDEGGALPPTIALRCLNAQTSSIIARKF